MSGARLVSSEPVELGGPFYVVCTYFDERAGWHKEIMLVVNGEERPVEPEAIRNAVLAARDQRQQVSWGSGLATRVSRNAGARDGSVTPAKSYVTPESDEATEVRKLPAIVEEVLAVLNQGEAEGWAWRTGDRCWRTGRTQKELCLMMPSSKRWKEPRNLFAHLRNCHGIRVVTRAPPVHRPD